MCVVCCVERPVRVPGKACGCLYPARRRRRRLEGRGQAGGARGRRGGGHARACVEFGPQQGADVVELALERQVVRHLAAALARRRHLLPDPLARQLVRRHPVRPLRRLLPSGAALLGFHLLVRILGCTGAELDGVEARQHRVALVQLLLRLRPLRVLGDRRRLRPAFELELLRREVLLVPLLLRALLALDLLVEAHRRHGVAHLGRSDGEEAMTEWLERGRAAGLPRPR